MNRTNEAYDVERELTSVKRCIMQYLADTGEVDLEAADLLDIPDAVDPPAGRGHLEYT